MRLQLNKHGKDDFKTQCDFFWQTVPLHLIEDKEIRTFKKSNQSVSFSYERFGIFYICPNCGCEIFAHWRRICPELKLTSDHGKYVPKHQVGQMLQQTYSYEYYDAIEKIIKEYNNRYDKLLAKEIGKIAELSICPLCKATLSSDETYALQCGTNDIILRSTIYDKCKHISTPIMTRDIYGGESKNDEGLKIDEIFEYIKKKRRGLLRRNGREEAIQFIRSSNVPQYAVTTVKRITSTSVLKDYILNLINLETNLLSLSKRLQQLYSTKSEISCNLNEQRYSPLIELQTEVSKKEEAVTSSENELNIIKNKKIGPPKISYPEKPAEPIYRQPNLFNKKRVLAENEQLKQTYESKLKLYEQKFAECESEKKRKIKLAEEIKASEIKNAEAKYKKCVDALNDTKQKYDQALSNINSSIVPASAEKLLLDSELSQTEEAIIKNYECRNKLYAYNIVFAKYCNIVALSTFYEYLMSGRCTSLEGPTGAYNIYENEVRMDRIIDQLDTVLTSLEQIKKNQYMIYNKLQEMNSSLHRLESTMNKAVTSIDAIKVNTDSMNKYMENISKNTDVIAHNSAVSAYYSKVNAELTNALGFMVALG